MYVLCDSEVVAQGCYYAALVSYSTYWVMGFVPAATARFPVRDYFAEVSLCVCLVGHSLLV